MKTAKKIQAGRAGVPRAMKSSKSKISIGTAGVEARLFVVKGYRTDTPITDETTGKRNPMDRLRIGASDIDDVLAYIRRFEKGFDIHEVRLVGLVVVTSGSSYEG